MPNSQTPSHQRPSPKSHRYIPSVRTDPALSFRLLLDDDRVWSGLCIPSFSLAFALLARCGGTLALRMQRGARGAHARNRNHGQ